MSLWFGKMGIITQSIVSSALQGDVSYYIRVRGATHTYIDFELIAFSDYWDAFDIEFEYRRNERSRWVKDAVISQTTATNIYRNYIYGLRATQSGYVNFFRWKYAQNNIYNAELPIIRINIIPRVIVYGEAGTTYYTVSRLYGKSKSDLESLSMHRIVGKDYNGYYMCVDANSFYLFDSSKNEVINRYEGLLNPTFAIATLQGNYIICETGNNRVFETDIDFEWPPLREYPVLDPVFAEYAEPNGLLLVTSQSPGVVQEIIWDVDGFSAISWISTYALNEPSCATYQQGNVTRIVIADTGNNQIVQYNRDIGEYNALQFYKFSDADEIAYHELSRFHEPFRAYQYDDGKLCVIEKEGIELTWDTVASSSSSSSSSSSESITNFSSSSSSLSSGSSSSKSSVSSSSTSSTSSLSMSSTSSSESIGNVSSSSSSTSSSSSSSSSSSQVEGCIYASGFGLASANGAYYLNGTYGNKPRWTNANNIHLVWWFYYGKWAFISVSGAITTTYYYLNSPPDANYPVGSGWYGSPSPVGTTVFCSYMSSSSSTSSSSSFEYSESSYSSSSSSSTSSSLGYSESSHSSSTSSTSSESIGNISSSSSSESSSSQAVPGYKVTSVYSVNGIYCQSPSNPLEFYHSSGTYKIAYYVGSPSSWGIVHTTYNRLEYRCSSCTNPSIPPDNSSTWVTAYLPVPVPTVKVTTCYLSSSSDTSLSSQSDSSVSSLSSISSSSESIENTSSSSLSSTSSSSGAAALLFTGFSFDVYPAANGHYTWAGTYSGKYYYSNTNGWYLWSSSPTSWAISANLGGPSIPPRFIKSTGGDISNIPGTYQDIWAGSTGKIILGEAPTSSNSSESTSSSSSEGYSESSESSSSSYQYSSSSSSSSSTSSSSSSQATNGYMVSGAAFTAVNGLYCQSDSNPLEFYLGGDNKYIGWDTGLSQWAIINVAPYRVEYSCSSCTNPSVPPVSGAIWMTGYGGSPTPSVIASICYLTSSSLSSSSESEGNTTSSSSSFSSMSSSSSSKSSSSSSSKSSSSSSSTSSSSGWGNTYFNGVFPNTPLANGTYHWGGLSGGYYYYTNGKGYYIWTGVTWSRWYVGSMLQNPSGNTYSNQVVGKNINGIVGTYTGLSGTGYVYAGEESTSSSSSSSWEYSSSSSLRHSSSSSSSSSSSGSTSSSSSIILVKVIGFPSPDATGQYIYGGTYGGHAYYHREDGNYYLFTAGIVPDLRWYLSGSLGVTANSWRSDGVFIEGTYEPQGSHTGYPIVVLT